MFSGQLTPVGCEQNRRGLGTGGPVGTNLYFAFHIAPPLGPPEPSAEELVIQRTGSDDGILALGTIAPTFTHSQLMAVGLTIGCVGLLGLRSRAWPAW